MIDGAVWAWPTVLWTHAEAMAKLPWLEKHSCRWRQWDSGGSVNFDNPDTISDYDKALVLEWLGL